MKRLLDTLIAYWKMIVSMGDYAFSLDRKKESPRPRLPQAHRYHALASDQLMAVFLRPARLHWAMSHFPTTLAGVGESPCTPLT